MGTLLFFRDRPRGGAVGRRAAAVSSRHSSGKTQSVSDDVEAGEPHPLAVSLSPPTAGSRSTTTHPPVGPLAEAPGVVGSCRPSRLQAAVRTARSRIRVRKVL